MKLLLVVVAAVLSLELALAHKQYLTSFFDPIYYVGTDLSFVEIEQAGSLATQFWDLNVALVKKLPDNENPEANLAAVKRMLGFRSSLCRPACLFDKQRSKERKKALQLFVSLEETSGKCDLESFKILAKILESTNSRTGLLIRSRIARVLTHYRRKHAEECRPKYRQMYDERIRRMNKDGLERLKVAFSGLKLVETISVQPVWDGNAVVGIPTIRFTDPKTQSALRHIVGQVIGEARKSSHWKAMKSEPAMALDEFLFSPCKIYHELLNEVLTPARFDVLVEKSDLDADDDDDGFRYFKGDYEFSDAIVYNRMCRSLLEEQQILKELMLVIWLKLIK